MEDYAIGILIVLVVLLIYWLFTWRPKKGVWYRNTVKSFNFGHLEYVRNCYIVINGKEMRGSFKVAGDKVLYILGWKYHKKGIRGVEKSCCSFKRHQKHIPLAGQGSSEQYITTYILRVR